MHNCDMQNIVADIVTIFPVVSTIMGVRFKVEIEVMAEATELPEGGWELMVEGYQINSLSRWESETKWEVVDDRLLSEWECLLYSALDDEVENDQTTRTLILEKVLYN